MKGTLFSADFIEDINGDLRLLEINTDTSATDFTYFDYTDFISVLGANNITKLTIVHKPLVHRMMVDNLISAINQNAPFITTIEEVKVSPNVIYPPVVSDDEFTFVLRLAYDETSIFDSEYAKGKLNLLTLFYDGNESGSVVEFYHSSQVNGQYNSITTSQINDLNLPDAAVKNVVEDRTMAKFYKIGSETENETNQDRWTNFINGINDENIVIQKYHVNSNSLVNNKVASVRSFSIVYGSNLDLVHLAHFKKFSIFDLPTGLTYNQSTYVNELDTKHFHEFATNYIKYGGQFEGILNTHEIIKSDDTEVQAGDLVVGDYLKSYYIGDTSLYENDTDINTWQISGSNLPSGSFLTSSIIIYKNTKVLEDKALSKLVVNNNEDSLYTSPVKSFLVHDSNENVIKWKTAIDINENTDYLIDFDGTTAVVSSNELFITNDNGFSLVEIDVEDTDTYIIAGQTPINAFITHNAPCFVAGTMVTLEDGSLKKIEDVKSGDIVSTFDLKTGEIKQNVVNAVFSKQVNQIVEYKFNNGDVLKCTSDHPIFVEGKGWTSYDSTLSNEMYSLEEDVKQIEIGDNVKLFDGLSMIVDIIKHEEDTLVYNLQDIEGNHNFFANNVLVHNRFCFVAGTNVLMFNGESKNIEDIKVDDEVLSFNEQKGIMEIKKVVSTRQPLHSDLVKYRFDNSLEVTSTHDHPFYVNGYDLASYKPSLTNERYNLEKEVKQIQVGDVVQSTDSEAKIVSILELPEVETQTYIITVEDNHNFYANGILVHNK
jgi:intein/homing endonuclease